MQQFLQSKPKVLLCFTEFERREKREKEEMELLWQCRCCARVPFQCCSCGIQALIPLCPIAESQWHLSRFQLHLSNAQQSSCTLESSSLARPWAVSLQHITPATRMGASRMGKAHSDLPKHFLQIGNPSQSSSSPIWTSCNRTWQGKATTEYISSLTCSPKRSSTS